MFFFLIICLDQTSSTKEQATKLSLVYIFLQAEIQGNPCQGKGREGKEEGVENAASVAMATRKTTRDPPLLSPPSCICILSLLLHLFFAT